MKKKRYSLVAALVLLAGSLGYYYFSQEGPRELLERYFSSAIKQDYGTTYACYYQEYAKKVPREDYIKHRKEGSLLQSYRIVSLNQKGNTAQAQVLLTFGPSERAGRKNPANVLVTEDMQREGGDWKIKVWQ
jgi:hypothetical protein